MRNLYQYTSVVVRELGTMLAFVMAALSAVECSAQTNALPEQTIAAREANAVAPAGTKVYEPGEVYLPGSRVYVLVGKTGLGHEHGVVGQLKSGRMQLDAPRDAGQLVFDMQSFAADTDTARNFVGLEGTSDAATQRDVTANMLGNAVLDAAHFPTATFTITGVSSLPQPSTRGLPQYVITGDFALHGVTQRIQIVSDAEEKNGWIHLRGGFGMRQTQYGITPFSKAFGAIGVTDDLSIWGDLWLSKTRQTVPLAQARQ